MVEITYGNQSVIFLTKYTSTLIFLIKSINNTIIQTTVLFKPTIILQRQLKKMEMLQTVFLEKLYFECLIIENDIIE